MMNRPSKQSSGGRHGSRDEGRLEKKITDLWPNYLDGGYFEDEEKKVLRKEYVCRTWVEPIVKEMSKTKPALTTNQIRRFFQHCRAIERKLKSNQVSWEEVRPKFKFIDAASSDAFGKDPKKIPEIFHEFIKRNVDKVKTKEDFLNGFLPHFEALVGFGSFHLRKERN